MLCSKRITYFRWSLFPLFVICLLQNDEKQGLLCALMRILVPAVKVLNTLVVLVLTYAYANLVSTLNLRVCWY